MSDMNELIHIENLNKIYRRGSEEIHALRDIHVSIEAGSFTAIIGPSGSGKTTLLNMIGLLDRPSSGSIAIGGNRLTEFTERKLVSIRRKTIGFIFQRFLLFPTLTVKENIALPLLFNSDHLDYRDIDKILQDVGLTERVHHFPSQLSGGEMQRVAIGRSLMLKPPLILADEPTGNLDSTTAARIFDLFKALQNKGQTIVVVTHNQELAGQADKVLLLRDGMLINM